MEKRIYYLNERVNFGDSIQINGINLVLSEQLIKDNSLYFHIAEPLLKTTDGVSIYQGEGFYDIDTTDLKIVFRIASTNMVYRNLICFYSKTSAHKYIERERLFRTACEKYPIGTKVINPVTQIITTVKDHIKYNKTFVYDDCINFHMEEDLETHENGALVLHNGIWAITLNNVQYYEHLFSKGNEIIENYLKKTEPVLYWLGVLKTISEDLNKDFEFNPEKSFTLVSDEGNIIPLKHNTQFEPYFYFRNEMLAKIAIDIMGQKNLLEIF